MKRVFSIIVLLLIMFSAILPVHAQLTPPNFGAADDPTGWIPANFAGFVRIDASVQSDALNSLNLMLFTASFLQPSRVTFTDTVTFDTFFPLASFDLEQAAFSTDIAPWLSGSIVIAYRELSDDYSPISEETLLIFPTRDTFNAAAAMQRVIEGQDILETVSYRGVTIYVGDQTAIAFTPSAVLIGSDEILRATIDVIDGEGESITASAAYQQIDAALAADSLSAGTFAGDSQPGTAFAFVRGEAASNAVRVLLSTSDSGEAQSVLSAFAGALAHQRDSATVETALLNGEIEAAGARLHAEFRGQAAIGVQAHVAVRLADTPSTPAVPAAFDTSILNLIPRSAFIVQSGSNAHAAARDVVAGLPLYNFAGVALNAFPFSVSAAAQSGEIPTPDADAASAAIDSFFTAARDIGGVDIAAGVLDQLNGSYAFALMPRPNNPLPLLNTRYDMLLIAQVADTQTALAGVTDALELYLGESALESEMINAQNFFVLREPDTGEAVLRIGAVDGALVIGTGESAALALQARAGDNRLIAQDRWQSLLTSERTPDLYLDFNGFFNAFFPQVARGVAGGIPLNQMSVQTTVDESGLYRLDVRVTLPQP